MKKQKKVNYDKVRKEVKQSFYNYDKIFIDLINSLNKCETKKQLLNFISVHVSEFNDAPQELINYLNTSINNKMKALEIKDEIDLGKLRAISRQF